MAGQPPPTAVEPEQPGTAGDTGVPEAPPDESGWASPGRAALCWLACGMFGAVNAYHVLAALVGRAVFAESKSIEGLIAGIGVDGVPVPANALATYHWIETVRQIGRQPWMLGCTVLMGIVTGALLLGVIHPRLSLYIRHRYFKTYKLVLSSVLTVACLVLAFWRLPEEVMRTTYPVARAGFAGGLLLLLWHRKGWLHPDAVWPSYFMLGSRFVIGAGLGVLSAELLGHHPRPLDWQVLYGWQEYAVSFPDAGLWCAEAWRAVALHTVLTRAWFGLVVGGVALSLAPTGLPLRLRLRSVALLLILVAVGAAGFPRWRAVWRDRQQYGVDLVQVILPQLERVPPSFHRIILPTRAERPPATPAAPAASIIGLPLNPVLDSRISAVLDPSRPPSAGAHRAWIHRHDRATHQWSTPAALAVELAQVRSSTSMPLFAAILCETLSVCADSPAARQAVEALLDPTQFVWPTPDSLEILAGLAWRWGKLDAVRQTVAARRPDVLERFADRPPPALDGQVTGRVLLGGEPLANVRVGLIARGDSPMLRVPVLAPWPQRRILAAVETDAQGGFTLTGVPEGIWRVVVAVPGEQDPLRRGELRVEQDVPPVTIKGPGQRVELAPIRLRVLPRPASTRSA